MNGYDLDGVLVNGVEPEDPYVIISGRLWDEGAPDMGSALSVALRGVGSSGDVEDAGRFKATMINLWKVDRYFEDDLTQVEIIRSMCPECEVVHVRWGFPL